MARSIAVGLGLMEFPFSGPAAFWRWIDLCEAGGIDSLWQTDRLISRVISNRQEPVSNRQKPGSRRAFLLSALLLSASAITHLHG